MSSAKTPAASDFRVKPGTPLANAWKIAIGVGVLGLGASIAGYFQDGKRFAFSYLYAFIAFLLVGLGALFFVLIQYITKAGWSVTVRRLAELFMSRLWVFALLILPLVPASDHLFHQWMSLKADPADVIEDAINQRHVNPIAEHDLADKAANLLFEKLQKLREQREELTKEQEIDERDHLLKEKAPYLNTTSVSVRALIYMVVWGFLGWRYFSWSREQDRTKRPENTASAQRYAPIALILFAGTITFAAFDWLMSLDPFWYSTIFGVVIFACSAVLNMAVLILTSMALHKPLGDAVNVEHFHDMGKLMFGWLVFWAYVSFSQFFLIWYGGIPEEISFYHRRWDNPGLESWKYVSIALVVVKFAIPFWLLMSRNVKRKGKFIGLATGAAMIIGMHFVEMYWYVMPNYGPLSFHWMDITCLLGVGGIYLGVVLQGIASTPLIPIGDPRLIRALKFENA